MLPDKTGIILLNMGGPENLGDVKAFLYNIFSDREIIRLGPAFLQKPLARLIAYKRAASSMANYARIGGGSPIASITRAQQQALQERLRSDGDFLVTTAMRYWRPDTDHALREMAAYGPDTIVALSLYPHYSRATVGSSLNELKRRLLTQPHDYRLIEIPSWPDYPGYIECLAAKIRDGLNGFGGESVELLYSAHGLPISFIEDGDPYVDHLRLTISTVEKITGTSGTLCYQSRSGPVQWLTPATPDILRKVSRQGCRNVLLVPISFVSDHVETLYEINIEYRELASGLGMRLESTESLNTDPLFIESLRTLVLARLARDRA